MDFAGRINPFTQLNNVQVERAFNNQRRDIQALDYARESATFTVQDGDVIAFSMIPTAPNETVTVGGAVVSPRVFPFKEGMRVSDIIARRAVSCSTPISIKRSCSVRSETPVRTT